nr:hypothetical protein [Tanacetum cinerariifolium]
MEDDVDINTLTMKQYLAWVHDDIRRGVVKPKVDNDIEFEINRNFMRELKRKLFKGTNDEDAHEHVRRVLEITYLFHFPGITHDVVMLRVFPITLKGPALRWINRLLAAKALKSIQDMVEHSHNWYDKATTKESINDSSDKVDTKKLKENIHAIQDVEGLRRILTPTIHTLPNLKTAVQLYRPLGPVHDEAKVTREEEQDYDIPLHDGVMQPSTSETIHITPPDDDYVAPATNLILDKHLNECKKELFDMKGVNENGDTRLLRIQESRVHLLRLSLEGHCANQMGGWE